MSTVAIVWLVVGLLTAAVTTAMLIALIRHVMVLGRAVARFGEEVSPIATEVSTAASSASDRSRRLADHGPGKASGGSSVR